MDPTSFTGALDVIECAADGLVACDSEFRVLYLNPAATRLCVQPCLKTGALVWNALSCCDGGELEAVCRRVLTEKALLETEYSRPDENRCLQIRVVPAASGGLTLWLRDITERKQAEKTIVENRAALERHLREVETIYADAPIGLGLLDTNLRFLRINRRLAELNGMSIEDHLGRTLRETVPQLAPMIEPTLQNVLDTGMPGTDLEIHGFAPGRPGEEGHWLGCRYPLRDANGQIAGVHVAVQDVTERKLLELSLQEKTAELNQAQRLARVGSWTWDIDTDTITWSEEMHRIASGTEPQPISGFQGLERFHTPESWARLKAATEQSIRDGSPYEIEAESILPDGERCWRIIHGEVERNASGRITKMRGTAQDITARRRAEQSLRSAHAELAAIHAHAPMIFLVVDQDLRVHRVNQAAADLAGIDPYDMLGLRPGDSIGCLNALKNPQGCGHGPDCGECPIRLAALDTIRHGTRHDNVEAWLTGRGSKGPEERCLLVFTAPLNLAGEPQALICALDITQRKHAEQALRNSEDWLQESQRISRIGSYVLDCATGAWTLSRTLDEVFGILPEYPKTVESWLAIVHPDDREQMKQYLSDQVLRQGKPFDREYRIVRPLDGEVRWVHGRGALICNDSGQPVRMSGTIQDITDRRIVEEGLRQAQKLESLGRMAGGIAHDFNNLLTVINGYSGILLKEVGENDPRRESVMEIRIAGARATDLTRQLLAFSRKQIVEPQPVHLNRLIADHLGILRRLAGEDVEIETHLATRLGNVTADPGQMHQVLLNLVVNARDAMADGGKITIATGEREGPAGRHVLLAITDSGTGIDPSVQDHIFDPFFTTKGIGAGTGLGLATVYGIVKQTGGAISFQTEVGHGTTFLISLPCSSAAEALHPENVHSADDPKGIETILVVEDQESVRKLAMEMLAERGYRVLEASQGEEALQLAEGHADPIHLLLTDVVMPHMTGPQLAGRLTALRPDMKVLYMSGYAEDAIVTRGLLAPGIHYIAKPFTPETLSLKVREALAPGNPAAPPDVPSSNAR